MKATKESFQLADAALGKARAGGGDEGARREDPFFNPDEYLLQSLVGPSLTTIDEDRTT